MTKIKKISIFWRKDNKRAEIWDKKITSWIKGKYPSVRTIPLLKEGEKPDAVIVLGGDGTIIEVARDFGLKKVPILGLNLGHVGFMASIRKEKDFLPGLEKFFSGKFRKEKRMTIKATLRRKNKNICEFNAINEIAIQHLFGMVSIKVEIEDHPFQYIKGNGLIVSTASGSTAYNLSAHGPIVMPELRCFVVTELLDHNIPTPSVILKEDTKIKVTIEDFRKNDRFIISKNSKKADVIIAADSAEAIPLEKGDVVVIKNSKQEICFVELEKNYFLKSLQEKFAFK